MGRAFNINTSEIADKDYKCGWKGCEAGIHKHTITYPDEKRGETSKKTEIPDKTILSPHEVFRQVGALLGPSRGKNDKGQIKMRSNINTYKKTKHHVIPGEIFVSNCIVPFLKHNLKLIGWDMNHGYLNGLSLPTDVSSAAWHGLQRHDGGHDPYTRKVENSLKSIDSLCKKFCKTEQQDELEELIWEKVEFWKEEIANWNVLIHSGSPGQTAAELNKAQRYIRLSSRKAFPGDMHPILRFVPPIYLPPEFDD